MPYLISYSIIINSVNYFEDIKISALSLLKMVIHAKSGGNIEIMGLLLGKVSNMFYLII